MNFDVSKRIRWVRTFSDEAWFARMAVNMHRARKLRQQHRPLREQLSLNRGKLLGLPKFQPRTRYQERLRSDRARRWRDAMLRGCPF